MTPDPLADAVAEAIGVAHVLREPAELPGYETDWTRRFHGKARFVARPGDTGECAAVLRLCAEAGAAIVPQGGNTGLVGGSVPRGGEVVLSTLRTQQLGAVDVIAGQVTADAGVTLEQLQTHVRTAGFDFGVDLAARGSATVGGMVATNAGGTRVLRYGSMREQVLGLQAVLADGSVISRLSGVAKDNSGYDLPALLAGSEGTLAAITRVRLRLIPLYGARATVLLGLAGTRAALDVAAALRRRCPSLESLEVFYREGLALVCHHAGIQPPFAASHGAYLVAECAGQRDPSEELLAALADCPGIEDSAFAVDRGRRSALWAYRERHTEAINAAGVPVKLDVAVPLAQVVQFESEVRLLLAEEAPAARPVLFGHLAEGNFHVNLLGLAEDGEERVTGLVLGLVAQLGGSISSEHGIGIAKPAWLSLTRVPADIAAMQAIKRALDPAGLMNPGVIFPK